MYKYTAFGLGIDSEFPLPELQPEHTRADVTIRQGNITLPLPFADKTQSWIRATNEEVMLHWEQTGTFFIRGGQEIIVDAESEVPAEILRLSLLGAAMGLLLCQRNLMVFHASAVALNGKAIAFLGDKGWGKSTMTVALHAMGHTMVADDVLAIDSIQDHLMVLPGIPQMKLWPDSILSIGKNPDAVPRIHHQWEKRNYQILNGFSESPLPLQAIYILGQGKETEIEPVEGSQAVFEVLRHWYCTRFGTGILQKMGYATHFLQCAKLVSSVPVYHLKRPHHLPALANVVQLLEEHCGVVREGSGV